MAILQAFTPNDWPHRGINPLNLLDSYKQVYGLTSQELGDLLQYFFDIVQNPELTCETSVNILKVMNRLK